MHPALKGRQGRTADRDLQLKQPLQRQPQQRIQGQRFGPARTQQTQREDAVLQDTSRACFAAPRQWR